ncbi:MAG: PrsW family intramembrane metalloprotease [Actinomycetota bacterium]
MSAPSDPARGSTRPRALRIGELRWGHTTSLFQLREPAFWLFAGVLVATGVSAFNEESLFHRVSASGWALSWGLLLLYAIPFFLGVYFLDLYEREPLSLMVGALLWGGVAATSMAGVANEHWGEVVARLGGPEFASRWTAAFTGPPVEETLKVVGVVLIYLIARDEIDDIMDGFVYGALVGLGFAVVEDVFYFVGVFGGSTHGVLTGFFLRVISSGLYTHVVWAGLSGVGVAYFVSRRDLVPLSRRIGVAGGLFGSAVFGHFLWNSPWLTFIPSTPWHGVDWLLVPLATAVKGIPFLAFVAAILVVARHREERWLAIALDSEVGRGGLTAEDLQQLDRPGKRRRVRRSVRERAGARAGALVKRLQREQLNLAMVRARVTSADDPDLVRQREYCRSLRSALAAIPGALPTV